MDRTRISLAIMVFAVSLAVTWVAADLKTSHTPLYTFRMEQLSNNMGFLPAERSEFMYTAAQGCYQNCNIPESNGKISFTNEETWIPTCEVTCPDTCPITCDDPTCINTCEYTHWGTCPQTCPDTCERTCRYTCTKPCQP